MKRLDVFSLTVGFSVTAHAAWTRHWGWFSALAMVLSLHVYLLHRRAIVRRGAG